MAENGSAHTGHQDFAVVLEYQGPPRGESLICGLHIGHGPRQRLGKLTHCRCLPELDKVGINLGTYLLIEKRDIFGWRHIHAPFVLNPLHLLYSADSGSGERPSARRRRGGCIMRGSAV